MPKSGRWAVFPDLAFPNANHVAEQAQPHERGVRTLVFPKEVEEGVGAADFGGDKQVSFGTSYARINEGAGQQDKGVPMDKGRERRLQMVAQKGGGVPGIGKGRAKEFVVRLVQGIVRYGVARPAEETAATLWDVARGAGFGRSNREAYGSGNRILIANWTCGYCIAL